MQTLDKKILQLDKLFLSGRQKVSISPAQIKAKIVTGELVKA